MKLFTILRQCCSLQMSKYELLRLSNNCNMTYYKNSPKHQNEYPNCERYDEETEGNDDEKDDVDNPNLKTFVDVEKAFTASLIPHISNNPEYNWDTIGDCTKFRTLTKEKHLGFNGKYLASASGKQTNCQVRHVIKR